MNVFDLLNTAHFLVNYPFNALEIAAYLSPFLPVCHSHTHSQGDKGQKGEDGATGLPGSPGRDVSD